MTIIQLTDVSGSKVHVNMDCLIYARETEIVRTDANTGITYTKGTVLYFETCPKGLAVRETWASIQIKWKRIAGKKDVSNNHSFHIPCNGNSKHILDNSCISLVQGLEQ